jgi:S-disulfanyl-L-cysteine oxidoreductase SoxD
VKHRKPGSRLLATGLTLCGLIGASALYGDEATHSIWDGVYTVGQAQRGAAEYTSNCVNCHMDSLAGDGADVPPLAGRPFLDNWDGLDLSALFDRIHTTMPQSNPGSLSAQQVVDLMAYLLSANQFPAGTKELPGDAPSLRAIQFQAKKPSH